MDARVPVVGILEERVEIQGKASESVTGVPGARTRPSRPLLNRLEGGLGGVGQAPDLAARGIAVAQHRTEHVGAVARSLIVGAVVGADVGGATGPTGIHGVALEFRRGHGRSLEAIIEIGVHVGHSRHVYAGVNPSIGDGNLLTGAGIPVAPGGSRPHDTGRHVIGHGI